MAKNSKLICRHCGKEFKQAKRFEKHRCEPMRRYQARQEKPVRLALMLYNVFYKNEINRSGKPIDFSKFEKNSIYKAFVAFGYYCHESNVFAPEQYMGWLLKNKIGISYWCKDSHYDAFLVSYLQQESSNAALERAILFADRWEQEYNIPAHDMLRFLNEYDFVSAITNGRLSPWVLYHAESGKNRLHSLPTHNLQRVWSYINTDVWSEIFDNHGNDVDFVKFMLKTAGW